MSTTKTEEPSGEKPKSPGVDDDPTLIAARLKLELAKVEKEEARLGLVDQAERAKLVNGMLPDFSTVTVEKDTLTASEQTSAVAECLIQGALFNVVDDIADDVMEAVNASLATGGSPPPATFFVTTTPSHRDDVAAYRDVDARLMRLHSAISSLCPDTAAVPGAPDQHNIVAPAITAALGALPGAITMATRLFAHQYVTSSYTSTNAAGVDLHAAGSLLSRVAARPETRVLVRRLQPARDADLEARTLQLALVLDGRLARRRVGAHGDAAVAKAKVDQLSARRAQLRTRADELHTAWKDKVGKSASSAGLSEDLDLVDSLEEAIAGGEPDSKQTKRFSQALAVVKKRIETVLEAIASGTGEMGAAELLEQVQALDNEAAQLADEEATVSQEKAQTDQRVSDLDAVHAAGLEFIESLGAADSAGERLFDKACFGALLSTPGTLALLVRVVHAGADGIDDLKLGPDHRITVFGGSVEWALQDHEGNSMGAGVRTQIKYQKTGISKPDKSSGGILVGSRETKPRIVLATP
ncbi:hypothetical protein [Ornithinimicrobium cryptoxanthini]|uniref:Uncharacterized protein n=1 Tax=Ornithinimicrobium cryptoxanthini TaxID=2934161 RepID=A0ABY4YMH1_9MICO|nr:hypothetical protein [Ornithinimicrobium cryptoxanthini]USQ77352.1 hypothetical protein NF557_05415 [Ornithinimicrobium cryptoxanthini]